MAPAARAEQVVAAIRRLIDPDVAIAGWRALSGGTGARCFAVEVAGRRVVAKLADPSTPTAMPLDVELRVLEHAASIGIAPAPIGADPDLGLLLYEFVDAEAWMPGDFSAPANIARVAARLRMLHTLPTDIRPYEPQRFAAIYVAASDPEDRARAESLAAELDAQLPLCVGAGVAVVCHNDLHVSNVLRARDLMFIDFEYAVAAPAIVDLASVIAMNRLDARAREQLIAAYHDETPVPFDDRALAAAVRVHELIAELWHLARAGRARDSAVEPARTRSGVKRE